MRQTHWRSVGKVGNRLELGSVFVRQSLMASTFASSGFFLSGAGLTSCSRWWQNSWQSELRNVPKDVTSLRTLSSSTRGSASFPECSRRKVRSTSSRGIRSGRAASTRTPQAGTLQNSDVASRNSAEERRTSAVVVPAFIADSMDFVIVSRMA